jgi:hypothetical protein
MTTNDNGALHLCLYLKVCLLALEASMKLVRRCRKLAGSLAGRSQIRSTEQDSGKDNAFQS